MSKLDLQAHPILQHKRESIQSHLSVAFAASVVSKWIEDQTAWSFTKFLQTARRCRTIEIQVRNRPSPPRARTLRTSQPP